MQHRHKYDCTDNPGEEEADDVQPVHDAIDVHFCREAEHHDGGLEGHQQRHGRRDHLHTPVAHQVLGGRFLLSARECMVQSNRDRNRHHHPKHDEIGGGEPLNDNCVGHYDLSTDLLDKCIY